MKKGCTFGAVINLAASTAPEARIQFETARPGEPETYRYVLRQRRNGTSRHRLTR